MRPWLVLLLILMPISTAHRPRPNILKRKNPSFSTLSSSSLSSLATLTDMDDLLDFNSPTSLLSQLLVPRVAGTPSLIKLQKHFVSFFTDLGWKIEKDAFQAETPYGLKEFTNLIFTHDPSAPLQLILSAHLDSKFFPDEEFIGATDSAAPCAILADVAKALTPWLDQRRDRIKAEGGEDGGNGGQREGLKIVLFDGEEAFKDWTHTDSIYGAKHLASLWSKALHSPSPTSPPTTILSSISHLILLDLLGSPHPSIRSFYPQTGWLFDEFIHAEESLSSAGLLFRSSSSASTNTESGSGKEKSFFVHRNKGFQGFAGGGIEDDHLPFAERGVNVVHLIPLPFPSVWHTIKDDATALDLPTIKAWALIVRLTIAEYLGLDPNASTNGERSAAVEPSKKKAKKESKRNELVSFPLFLPPPPPLPPNSAEEGKKRNENEKLINTLVILEGQ